MKKILSILVASIIIVSGLTTAYAVDNHSGVNLNTVDTSTEKTSYDIFSEYMRGVSELSGDFKELGKVGDGTLFHGVTGAFADMTVYTEVGDYVIYCSGRDTNNLTCLYIVRDNNVYRLEDAYNKGFVNMDAVYDLVNAYDGKFALNLTMEKTSNTNATTEPYTKTPYDIFSEYMRGVSELSGDFKELGKVGDGTLFHGVTGACADMTVYTEVGDYVIYCSGRDTNNLTCLYIVRDNNVYRLEEAYNKGFVNMDEVYNLVNAYDGKFALNLKIEKTSNTNATTEPKPIPTKPVIQPVATSIRLNRPSVTIYTGKYTTLKATVGPSNIASIYKKVTWSTSNKKVATVTSKGKVVARGKGTCVITVRSTDNKKLTAKCRITVKQRVTSVKFSKSSVTLPKKNKYATVKVYAYPSNANNRSMIVKSENTRIAKINRKTANSGQPVKITAVKRGTTYVRAAARDGSKKYARCRVVVKK